VIATEADRNSLNFLSSRHGSAVTVNGAPKTLGVSGLHEGRDYYWSYNSNVLTAEVAPARGTGGVDLPGPVPDPCGRTDRRGDPRRRALEGGTGVYEAIADDPAINVQTVAVQKALAYLRKHGVIPQTIRSRPIARTSAGATPTGEGCDRRS